MWVLCSPIVFPQNVGKQCFSTFSELSWLAQWDPYLLLIINEDDCIVCGGHHVYRCVCFVKFIFHTKASGSNMWHQYREPDQLMSGAQTCLLHVYMLLWMCFQVILTDAMKYPVWGRGVNSNSNSTGWPFCCWATHLWLQGMANGCRPCSMFSIGSIQHLSTQRCILIYPPVPLPLPACRAQHQSTPWLVVGHCNLPGLSEG